LDDADAGVEELLGPGGGGAEVEGPDLAGTAAEQLEAEGGSDEALPARHREPHALDPSFALRCIFSAGYRSPATDENLGGRPRAANPGEASAVQYDADQLDDGV
jgi:hypothetical protein